jgi:hypothetical protein
VVVNNEADGEEHLKKQVEELFRNLFQNSETVEIG